MSFLNQLIISAKEVLNYSLPVATALSFLHVTTHHLVTVALPYGPSMIPTFNLIGDVWLVERISHKLGKVGSGDIVLVRSPVEPRKVVTKRVVGLEGDSVTYVVDPNYSDRTETIVVPKGHIWIEGDNVYASKDSRRFGAVPYGLLEGKYFWKIWPPRDFRSFEKSAK